MTVHNEPASGGTWVCNEVRGFEHDGEDYAFVVPSSALFRTPVPVELLRALPAGGFSRAELEEASRGWFPPSAGVDVSGVFDLLRRAELVVPLGWGTADGKEELARFFRTAEIPLGSLVCIMSQRCNLACSYCYAADTFERPEALMSEETAGGWVDFLLARSGDHERPNLVFFGGEPLLNWKVIQAAVAHAHEREGAYGKRVQFSLTTNATLLTEEKVRYICEHDIGVTVSIDGPPEVNDRTRTFRVGGGTYDRVARGVRMLREGYERPLGARVTVTKRALELGSILDDLLALGFYEVGFGFASTRDEELALDHDDTQVLLGEFRRIAARYVDDVVDGRYLGCSNVTNVLRFIHEGLAKSFPCGAGLGLVSGTPDGLISLCHRLVGKDQFVIGSLDEGIDREAVADLLSGSSVTGQIECQSCWARYLCSGGCYHLRHLSRGTLDEPYTAACDFYRSWIALGLETYVELSKRAPEFIEQFIDQRSE